MADREPGSASGRVEGIELGTRRRGGLVWRMGRLCKGEDVGKVRVGCEGGYSP